MDKLTNCKYCKKDIKDKLDICSHCGKSDPLGLEDEVKDLISKGKVIEAIERVLFLTGKGLKVSKDYVDTLS